LNWPTLIAVALLKKAFMGAWRKIGPIGCLHNIVTFIRGFPQRIQAFLQGQASDDARELAVNVISNNKTRWNSTYYMIARALRHQSQLDNYVSHQIETRQGLADNVLKGEVWVFLRKLHELLQLFEKATKKCEGHAQLDRACDITFVCDILSSALH
jgi:hypothetical protein